MPIEEFARRFVRRLKTLPRRCACHRRAGALHRGARGDFRGHRSWGAPCAMVAGGTTSTTVCTAATAVRCTIIAVYPVDGTCATPGQLYPSVLAGPTCDSIDVIRENIDLPKLDDGRSGGRAHDGRLHLGLGLRIQFLPAGHGAGAGSRPAVLEGGPIVEFEPPPSAAGGALAGIVARRPWAPRRTAPGEADRRSICADNLHTDERLDSEYFASGAYCPQALAAIDVLLRDFRNVREACRSIRSCMDYLVEVAARGRPSMPEFSVISGYRSPQTNESCMRTAAAFRNIACTCRAAPSMCA